jgi:hypothetical protein
MIASYWLTKLLLPDDRAARSGAATAVSDPAVVPET